MLPANNNQRITWHEGVQARLVDSFQIDRKPKIPENGHQSVNTLHGQESEIFWLKYNWRRKADRVRKYPLSVTVVGLRPSATKDSKTPQIRQKDHAFDGIRKESCITKNWKAARRLIAIYTVSSSSELIKTWSRLDCVNSPA